LFLNEEEEDYSKQSAQKRHRKSITPQELRNSEWGRSGLNAKAEEATPRGSVLKDPHVIDLGNVMGIRMWRGQIVDTDGLLSDLITHPTPLMLELRRQHMIECFMFTHRLQKALRASHVTAFSENGSPMINARQADVALAAADPLLTEDQRCIYVLRGFGRRLPDPPSVEPQGNEPEHDFLLESPCATPSAKRGSMCHERDVENACKRAATFHKTRKLLKERIAKLVKEDNTVATDVFVRRLQSAGVVKSADIWHPEVTVQDVVRESGLEAVRLTTAVAPLQELVGSSSSRPVAAERSTTASVGDLLRSRTSTFLAPESEADGVCMEVVERYDQHAVSGRDIQELSIGYTQLGLLHWLAAPC
jgi:hypothetical protein